MGGEGVLLEFLEAQIHQIQTSPMALHPFCLPFEQDQGAIAYS